MKKQATEQTLEELSMFVKAETPVKIAYEGVIHPTSNLPIPKLMALHVMVVNRIDAGFLDIDAGSIAVKSWLKRVLPRFGMLVSTTTGLRLYVNHCFNPVDIISYLYTLPGIEHSLKRSLKAGTDIELTQKLIAAWREDHGHFTHDCDEDNDEE